MKSAHELKKLLEFHNKNLDRKIRIIQHKTQKLMNNPNLHKPEELRKAG